MARPKYVPTDKQLKRAWTLKQKRLSVKEICVKLKISYSQYDLNRKLFNKYFAQRKKSLINKNTIDKNAAATAIRRTPLKGKQQHHNVKIPFNKIKLEELASYVLCGFSREKIADLIGVSRRTLFNYSEEFPPIRDILENSRHRASSNVVASLFKMTGDRMIDDTAVASYLGEITTKQIKKAIPANIGAVKYWMANAHNWTDQGKPETQNNKGTILAALDEAMNGDPDVHERKEGK